MTVFAVESKGPTDRDFKPKISRAGKKEQFRVSHPNTLKAEQERQNAIPKTFLGRTFL